MKSIYIKKKWKKNERRKVFLIGIEKREKDEWDFFLFETCGELLELNLDFFSLCWIDFLLFVKHTINKVIQKCVRNKERAWWYFKLSLVTCTARQPVCFCVWKYLKRNYFLFRINIFISFLCVDIKNNFFKIKKYYFNVFQMKNTLKHNYYKHWGWLLTFPISSHG